MKDLENFKNDGYRIIRFDFNGSGDSGYIESTGFSDDNTPVDAPASLEDFFYECLNNAQSGWEINEGSNGVFHFDFENNTIDWNHSQNYEESFRDDLELGHF